MKGMIIKHLKSMIQDGDIQINVIGSEVWAQIGKDQLKVGEVKNLS